MSDDKAFDFALCSSSTDASSTTMDTIQTQAGVATCTSGIDSSPLTVSGVAISAGEITRHEDGNRRWPEPQLMAAVDSLEGKHLTKNHNHDAVEGVVGEVTKTRYKEGVGILFEAQVYDEEVALKIQEGLLDVSVHAAHKVSHIDDDGNYVVENVRFRDLSVVPRGAADGNTVSPGALQVSELSEDSVAELVEDEFTEDTMTYREALNETADNFDITLAEHELDSVYSEWQDTVNMTAGQLRQWSENPCSREASVRPSFVIRRNLRLLEKPKSEWTQNDVEDARRTISFINRMSAQRPTAPRDGPNGCPSPWAISLMNWAYNPFDELPSVPEEMEPVEEITAKVAEAVQSFEGDSETHMPQYESTESGDGWDAPNLEDFPVEYFDEDDTPRWDLIDNHFLYSETGFPPENYTDLGFPVVDPDGTLWLAALRAVKSRAPQSDAPEAAVERLQEMADTLAAREFDKDWSDDAESDDGSEEEMGQSSSADTSDTDETNQGEIMTEETETEESQDVDELEERVSELEAENERLRDEVESVRMEYATALAGDSAFSAEELSEKFTVDELAEKYDDADEVALAEAASEPAPQTGGVEDEVEASETDEETDAEVAELEQRIETYEDMGWDAAASEQRERLDELTAE